VRLSFEWLFSLLYLRDDNLLCMVGKSKVIVCCSSHACKLF
jgi:hypothetical protein